MPRQRVVRMRYLRYQRPWIAPVGSGGGLLGQQRGKKGPGPRARRRGVRWGIVVGRREQGGDAKVRLAWQLEERMVGHFFHGFGCVQRTFETHRDLGGAVELAHRFVPTIKEQFFGGWCVVRRCCVPGINNYTLTFLRWFKSKQQTFFFC